MLGDFEVTVHDPNFYVDLTLRPSDFGALNFDVHGGFLYIIHLNIIENQLLNTRRTSCCNNHLHSFKSCYEVHTTKEL